MTGILQYSQWRGEAERLVSLFVAGQESNLHDWKKKPKTSTLFPRWRRGAFAGGAWRSFSALAFWDPFVRHLSPFAKEELFHLLHEKRLSARIGHI
jgi:hypothetical protein